MKGIRQYYRLTLFESVLIAISFLGIYAAYLRRLEGWGSQTHLKEIFPWGLCAGLDVFCGLGLAVGGFMIAATLYLAGFEIYRPILRLGLLIGSLGFVLAILATVANRPFRPWALAVLWSPWGAFLGMGLALILYSTLLILEFVSRAPGQTGSTTWSQTLQFTVAILTVSAAMLSASQQSALTRLLTIAPSGFSPLWLTPMLPVQLFLSSVCACLALIIVVSSHASFAFHKALPAQLLGEIAKVMGVLLSLYVTLRFLDLFDSRAFPLLFEHHAYNYLLGIELCLFLLPALLLIRKHDAYAPRMLYVCAMSVTAGFAVNRLNTSITAREAVVGIFYVPRSIDLMIAFGSIALCVALFSLALRYLPVFSESEGISGENRMRTIQFPLHSRFLERGWHARRRSGP